MLDASLKLIERAIRRDLLEPAGLNPPHLPVSFSTPCMGWLCHDSISPYELGRTGFYQRAPHAASHIELNAWLAEDPLRTAATLTHEFIHASLPYKDGDGHDDEFAAFAEQLGLAGNPHATFAGPKFRAWFEREVLPTLPPVPTGTPHGPEEFYRSMDAYERRERAYG
jgi:hypothetical protein